MVESFYEMRILYFRKYCSHSFNLYYSLDFFHSSMCRQVIKHGKTVLAVFDIAARIFTVTFKAKQVHAYIVSNWFSFAFRIHPNFEWINNTKFKQDTMIISNWISEKSTNPYYVQRINPYSVLRINLYYALKVNED